jgi:hypothetical protein
MLSPTAAVAPPAVVAARGRANRGSDSERKSGSGSGSESCAREWGVSMSMVSGEHE